MPAELSIPYLKAVALQAVVRAENERDLARPLQRLFPRQGHSTDLIEVPIRQRRPNALPHTARDGEASPVNRGELIIRRYEPSWIKSFVAWSSADINRFVAAGDAMKIIDKNADQAIAIDRALELARDAAIDLATDNRTERERLCANALLTGAITTKLASGSQGETVDYGLTPIDPTVTSWDADADIVTDITEARRQFRAQNPDGLFPTVVFYDPSMYAGTFTLSAAFANYKKDNPELAANIRALAIGQNTAHPDGGFYAARLFDMAWVAVDGTYRALDGTDANYWDPKQLTLARPESALFQWAMTYGHDYNPMKDMHFETEGPQRADVKTWRTYAYDNGLPLIKRPEFVQTWNVVHS